MSNVIVNDILQKRLNAVWNNRTPIVWDNLNNTPVLGEAFIRCVLDAVDSSILSMSCTRTAYLFTVQIFTPSDDGVDPNLVLADIITSIFSNYIDGHLIVKRIYTERVGEEEQWHQRNVLIDLTYDNHL